MSRSALAAAAAALALSGPAAAHSPIPGDLVAVSVEVDGRTTASYPARDGSGRFYVEARTGSEYAIRLENRTGQRVAVALAVDGLNVISGDREEIGTAAPGRMYVLDPWGATVVRGWRTDLSEVRQFTFVDEAASYAVRSGKSNGKLGWIEMAVYREQYRPQPPVEIQREGGRYEEDGKMKDESARGQDAPAAPAQAAPGAEAKAQSKRDGSGYPGTGWGDRRVDQARVVSFEPESWPAQRTTVRYEYARTLRAMGLLPSPPVRDRLAEREDGRIGFAQPPMY